MLFYFMFYKMFYQSNYIITIQTQFVNMFFHIFIYFIISKHIFCIFFTINTQKNGKKTVVTVFFPFFTIISFFNFTQLLVFHTYQVERSHSLCNLSVGAFNSNRLNIPLPYAPDAVYCLSSFKKFTILPYVL